MGVHKIRETEETLAEIQRQRDLVAKGIWQSQPKAIEVSRRNFVLEFLNDTTPVKLNVREIIVEWGSPLLHKVVWVRRAETEIKVDDNLNPMFHYNCCVNSVGEWKDLRGWQYKHARDNCKQAFVDYWKEKAKGND